MTAGMIRVQNEGRWISRVVRSIAPLCEQVFVFDDHSTDDTADICRREGCVVLPSPFTGFDQRRDMQHLYEQTMVPKPDWIISIDGDEELAQADQEIVRAALSAAPGISFYTMRILYLWDKEHQVRVDGVYKDFRRKRIFKPTPKASFSGGLHTTGAGHIAGLTGRAVNLEARLLHYGYLHREDRIRKYRWHNQSIDPANNSEDSYKHMVIGDLFPPDSQFLHAGPLTLRAL